MRQLTAFQEGQRLFLKGDLPASIKAFSCAIAGDIEPLKSHLSRGAAHLKIGNLEKALIDFNEAVTMSENPGQAYFYRGIVLLNKGDFQKAIADLTESLCLDPTRGAALLARGLAYAELGRLDEAEVDFSAAYAMNNTEIGSFLEEYAISRPIFDRTMALFEGESGPWKLVLTRDEVVRMNQ